MTTKSEVRLKSAFHETFGCDLSVSNGLDALLRYDAENGGFTWRRRSLDMFPSERIARTWNTRFAGKTAFVIHKTMGYQFASILGIKVYGHQVAWAMHTGVWPSMQIDHINGVRHDNRFCNLREVTASENRRNQKMRSDNTSGFTGVSFYGGKWVAELKGVFGKRKLGSYERLDDAIAAREMAAEIHGFHENHGRKE